MCEVPEFGVGVALENSLLKVWNLMESVHVQLPHKGAEVPMFEPSTQYLMGETLVVKN